MTSQWLYALAQYVRDNVNWPGIFDPELQVICGGEVSEDPVEMVYLFEQAGTIDGQQDMRQVPYQFLVCAIDHGRSRDLVYAIHDSEALGYLMPEGRMVHERYDFDLAPYATDPMRVAKFGWLQTPTDLGSTKSGYCHSINAIMTTGNA